MERPYHVPCRVVIAPLFVLLFAWPALGVTVVVDNSDPAPTFTGNGMWATQSAAEAHGGTYAERPTVPGIPAYYWQWQPDLPEAGAYQVSVWYPARSDRPVNAVYTVYYSGGSRAVTVDQTSNGSQWVSLGTFIFPAGRTTGARVTLYNDSAPYSKYLAGDAVSFTPAPALTMAVSPDGAGTTLPAAGSPTPIAEGAIVTIRAIPGAGYSFGHWRISAGADVTDPDATITTVTMDVAKTATAVFVPQDPARHLGDLTGPWQLFVDDHGIDTKTGLVRTYHAFEKRAESPVLVADKPWESTSVYVYGSVLPNEAGPGYRMWYHCLPSDGDKYRILYATSPDGIHWDKPDLGIVNYNGSTANNIFIRRTGKDHIPSILHTPWDLNPQRRYKMINYDNVYGFVGAYSIDGVQWTDAPPKPIVGSGDVGNFVWDPHTSQYLGYIKVGAYVNGLKRRAVGFSATGSFESWPSPYLILAPDTFDDRWATGVQRTHFYGMCGFAYESMYLGFLWVFRATDSEGYYDGTIFIELVSSHDGIHWTREEGERPPILPLGPADSWDDGMLFTTQHPLVEDGTIKLYYGGCDETHASPNPMHAGIGLATLRKDGFASLDAKSAAGDVTTKKLIGAVGPLHVNFSTAGDGWLKVEVLDENGVVLPGYGQADCPALQGDSLDRTVTWTTHAELPLSSAPLRLRFILRNASLYSYMAGNAAEVMEEPTITQQPAPQNICPGGNAQFGITATSNVPMSYQWQKNGADIGDGGHLSGTTTARLLILGADASDAAEYRCVVTNAAGMATSNSASLSFTPSSFEGLGVGSAVTGITTDGTVVCGTSGNVAFIWTRTDGFRNLGLPADATTSSAAGVGLYNGSVAVAVNTNAAAFQAKRWDGNTAGTGAYSNLPLMDGFQEWLARGLGTNGTTDIWIAGSSFAGGDYDGREAGRYQLSVNNTLSYPLPAGGHDNSDFHAVSDTGSFTGQFQYGGSAIPTGGARNAMKTLADSCVAMNSLLGAPSTNRSAVAKAISRDGLVQGGWSTGSLSGTTPVIWRDVTVVTAIPFLAGDTLGETKALNGDGTIAAGYSQVSSATARRAWIWDSTNGTRDLATLLQSYGVSVLGWQLNEVIGMSATTGGDYTKLVLTGTGTHNGVSEGWVALLGYLVTPPPAISQHPLPQNVCPGATATFSVTATSQGTPIYQWRKNGADLTDDGRCTGATTATLTISGAGAADVASYSCIVGGGCGGTVSSNTAGLTLRTATTITQHPVAQNVASGGTAHFSAAATGEGVIAYRWQKNGANLSDGGHYAGSTTATLTVSGVDAADVGDYRCVATGGCGGVASNSAPLALMAGTVAADFDGDSDVDLADFLKFQDCFNGPNRPPKAGCGLPGANLDGDAAGDVDLADFLAFQDCFNGPNRPPKCQP